MKFLITVSVLNTILTKFWFPNEADGCRNFIEQKLADRTILLKKTER